MHRPDNNTKQCIFNLNTYFNNITYHRLGVPIGMHNPY